MISIWFYQGRLIFDLELVTSCQSTRRWPTCLKEMCKMLPEKMNVFRVQVDMKIYIRYFQESSIINWFSNEGRRFYYPQKQVVAMYTKTLLYSNIGWVRHCILQSCHILDNGCRRKQCWMMITTLKNLDWFVTYSTIGNITTQFKISTY